MKNSDQPAMPVPCESQGAIQLGFYMGLTKREYFAAMAMQGLLANNSFSKFVYDNAGVVNISEIAVNYADSLFAELEKAK